MIHRTTRLARSSAERVAGIFADTMIQCGGAFWRETLVAAEMRATLTQIACGFDGAPTDVGAWTFPDGSCLDGGWLFPDRLYRVASTPKGHLPEPPQALVA